LIPGHLSVPGRFDAGSNNRYFTSWRRGFDLGLRRDRRKIQQLADHFSRRAGAFGYRMHDPDAITPLTECTKHRALAKK
jgi:hypothetical protein